MKILLISATLPPAPDGIGDYTARLSEQLSSDGHETTVWTSRKKAVDQISGVVIQQPFLVDQRGGLSGILKSLHSLEAQNQLPDAAVLQFNHFSWGRRGLNLHLPILVRSIKTKWPKLRLGVMFHEVSVPPCNWRFRIMRLWQVWQYRTLAEAADLRIFSIEKWLQAERNRNTRRPETDSIHLPVGSNLPPSRESREKTRLRLGISKDTFVMGSFGTAHPSRLINWVGSAISLAYSTGRKLLLLHVGPDGDVYRKVAGKVPFIDSGRLPADKASGAISSMDLFLSPFTDGISTRRGSLMAALSHGIPFVTTLGPLSDNVWSERFSNAAVPVEDGSENFAELVKSLMTSPLELKLIGSKGKCLYDEQFAWNRISQKLTSSLSVIAP